MVVRHGLTNSTLLLPATETVAPSRTQTGHVLSTIIDMEMPNMFNGERAGGAQDRDFVCIRLCRASDRFYLIFVFSIYSK